MNKKIHLALLMVAILLVSACNSVYKKHYGNGYTFLKKSHHSKTHHTKDNKGLQQQSIDVVKDAIKENKNRDVSKAEQSFETLHKKSNQCGQLNNQKADRSKPLIAAVEHLPSLSKEVRKLSNLSIPDKKPEAEANKLALTALILALASICSILFFCLVSFLTIYPLSVLFGLGSLILAIVSLVFAKGAKRIAELNGLVMPNNATIARFLSWTVIGFHILALLLLMLIVFLILLFSGF